MINLPDLSLVIPTYNERDNLNHLFNKIEECLTNIDYNIVLVDDDSPDETWKKARDLSKTYPLEVIRRKNERGLASAILTGINQSSGSYVVVMDADLQHPPEKIIDLFNELEQGNDIVIASRYLESGSLGQFSLSREIISRGANLFAKILFKDLRQISDLQSGFFAFNKKIIENKDFKPRGFKLLIDILVEADYKHVSEIGFTFRDRRSGNSSLNLCQIFLYIYSLVDLYFRD